MASYGKAYNAAAAEELRAIKARKRISTATLAEETGMGTTTIARYLSGEREIPMWAFIDLCGALGEDPVAVFMRAEEATQND